MSNLCDVCLEPRLTSAVNGVITATPASDFVLGAVSVNTLCTVHPRSVADSSGLLFLDNIAPGTVMFVEDVGVPVIYSNGKWLGLDGRVFIDGCDRGIAWTWGVNRYSGSLGDGTITDRNSPVTTAGGGTNWYQISAGYKHTVAVKTDGTAWTWGYNNCGQLGNSNVVARSSPGSVAGTNANWCQISAGGVHTAAIKTDGSAWTWGRNNTSIFTVIGQLGDGSNLNRSSPGAVAGCNQCWCQISAGTAHTGAIKTDGTAWTWGSNANGRLGNGNVASRCSPGTLAGGGTTWCQISAGCYSTAAVKTDGTAWTWGANGLGQLGSGTNVCRCSPGTLAGGGTTWCQISAGGAHAAAIKTDGTAWTWGINGFGQLGNGTTVPRSSPGTTLGGGTNWCQIDVGGSVNCGFTAAVKTDGTAWTWGNNCVFTEGRGWLGAGTLYSRGSPGTLSGGGTTWCQISAGHYHTAAIAFSQGT